MEGYGPILKTRPMIEGVEKSLHDDDDDDDDDDDNEEEEEEEEERRRRGTFR